MRSGSLLNFDTLATISQLLSVCFLQCVPASELYPWWCYVNYIFNIPLFWKPVKHCRQNHFMVFLSKQPECSQICNSIITTDKIDVKHFQSILFFFITLI
jgi:hypothetical protein